MGEGSDRVTLWLPLRLLNEIDRRVTPDTDRSKLMRAALAQAFLPEYADDTEAVLAKRIDQLQRRLQRHAQQSDHAQNVIAEMIGGFISVYFCHHDELPDALREDRQRLASRRFEKFLDVMFAQIDQRVSVLDTVPCPNVVTTTAPEQVKKEDQP